MHHCRAWKENLIKKVRGQNRQRIMEMDDDLGDIMYADSEENMWALWTTFQKTWEEEDIFIPYFWDEWMTKPCSLFHLRSGF